MKIKRIHILLIVLVLTVRAFPFRAKIRGPVATLIQVLKGKRTVADRVRQFGPAVQKRLAPNFDQIGVVYPPKKMVLVGFKQENRLEVWVSDPPKLVKSRLGAAFHVHGVLGFPPCSDAEISRNRYTPGSILKTVMG